MKPIDLLRAHKQVFPNWLAAYPKGAPLNAELFDAMLQSRVVFYPGSHCRDGLAFELFTHTHAAHCVIHADVMTDLDAVVAAVPGIRGYRPEVLRRLNQGEAREVLRLDEQPVPGLDCDHWMAQAPALTGAVWSILERKPGFGDEHGPGRLAFLHVKCEAAWLFWNLWLRRSPAPPAPFALIVSPEYGPIVGLFGSNGAAYRLEGGHAKRPDWILYDCALGGEWLDYEEAADDQPPRPQTLFRRLPDDHPRVVAQHLRNTDFDAYFLHCVQYGLQPNWL